MASKIVEREGRAYLLEDGKVVKSAATVAELSPESETPPVFNVGDRVEAGGKLGKVVSKMNTIYGEQFGVRDDEGEAFSFYAEDLSPSEEPEPVYDSPVDSILVEADAFEGMPADTLEQIEAKEAKGRELNLRARALVTDDKLPITERVKLDSVISNTAVDLDYLANDKENAILSAHQDELAAMPKFEIDSSVSGTSEFTTDDASWLGEVADQMEAEAGEIDHDTLLTEAAVDLIEKMEPGLLADDDTVMEQSHATFMAVTAGLDEDTKADKLLKFNEQIRTSRYERLEDLKEAALDPEEDEDELGDDSSLFL